MTERIIRQLVSILVIFGMLGSTIFPVFAADSSNISVDLPNSSDNLTGFTAGPSPDNETLNSMEFFNSDPATEKSEDSSNSSVNGSCNLNDMTGFAEGSLPDNETLSSLACFNTDQAMVRSADFASTRGTCVGDGRGLMEIHAPPGSVYAARGPWGWFDTGVPIGASGQACRIVDVCGWPGSQWEIVVTLPDGTTQGSGIFDFSQYPAPPGTNARCYYLFKAGSSSSIYLPNIGTSFSNPNGFYSNDPINLATGNYVHEHQDLFIQGRGLPLIISRYYNSLDPRSGPFGTGWTFNYNTNLVVTAESGDVIMTREDGHMDKYTPNPDGTYSSPPGVYDKLTKNADESFTLQTKQHITYHLAPAGQLVDIVDSNGNTISFTYTGDYLTRVTDSSGRELTFTYDAAGRIVSIADPIGRTTRYTYDEHGNLIRFTDAMGGEFIYTYDENHWMTTITNPRGSQVHNVYDADGRVTSQTNAQGAVYTFSYDPDNQRTTETDPLGRNTVYTFDDRGWGLSKTDDLGNTISYTYDNENRLSATDAIGRTVRFGYDDVGNVIQVIDPLGQSSTLNYDANNNLVGATNALGRQVTFSYDANNNLLSVTNPAGSVSTFTYDQYGQLVSGRDANGHDASLVYDNNGNPTAITDALGNAIMLSYDGVGRLTGLTDAKGGTGSFSYDALDRLVTVVDPMGQSASISYDSAGNRISTTDALGRTTSFSYDPMDQLTKVTDATGGVVTYSYDTVNNLASMTDANGHTTTYAYDCLNRLTSVTDPLGRISRNSYDAVGNTVSVTDGNGNTTGFTYDTLNRLTGITYADATSVGYTYDAIGNRLSMTDSQGTSSYAYDILNQLTSVASPGGKTVTYGYDAVGNTLRMTYPDGKAVSYAYDDLNRLSGVTDWSGNVTSYLYDANSNLAEMTYPNGVTTEYSYDQNNRLIKQVNKVRRGIVSSYEYTLDAAGNRVQVKEKYDYAFSKEMREQGVGEVYTGVNDISRQKDKNSKDGISLVTTYAYDPLNRLTSVKYPVGNTVTYSYDPMGNRMSMISKLGKISSTTSYSYDAGDQLLSAGKASYAYDNNGNLVKKTEPGKTTTYGYDGANRLSTVTLSQSSGHRMAGSYDSVNENDAEISQDSVNEKDTAASRNAGKGKAKTTTVHFTYDGDGVRTEKSVTSQSKTDATQYLWDINHGLPQVLTESGKKGTALYSYGLGRISMADPKKGSMYYQYDGLGSVRSLTDRKGMTKALYYYDVFGKPLITASPVDNDFQYTGEQVDDETGLIYLRSRYYDPEIGRFISRDPFAGFDTSTQSLNRYTYVQNNPVVYTDPSGKVAWYVPGLLGAAANTGWYIGEQAAIYVKTGENRGSWATLGGRAAGGFAGGTAASIAFASTGNPYLMGAAAGGAGYAADRLTQEQLSNFGLGKAEPRSWEGLALATGAGTVMGPVTNKIIPFSPENTGLQRVAQNVIFRSGAGSMNIGYNAAPNAYNYAINSCQGPPLRVGGGSYSGGKLY